MRMRIREPQPAQSESHDQRRGFNVIVLLAVLTGLEYVIAVELDVIPLLVTLLALIAVIKAGLILNYFMHFPRVWRGEGAH
jgi:cytochrome c oxidase subunit IV